MKKYGGFIPGSGAGRLTAEYLDYVDLTTRWVRTGVISLIRWWR
jgi:hypothetical protein